MKLKSKQTGEIMEFDAVLAAKDVKGNEAVHLEYDSIQKFIDQWEDYEEDPENHWAISGTGSLCPTDHMCSYAIKKLKEIGNYFETEEECRLAVEKLKAWKRLKDRGFEFCGYDALGCGVVHFTSDWDIEDEYEKGQRRKDLDLLFGGEE